MIKNLIFSSRLCLIKHLLFALFVKSQDRNGFGSFFLRWRRGDKQKKHKKIGKNNRGLGKIQHFVGVKKNKKRGKAYDIQN